MSKKIVYNNCYGGFDLSPFGELQYFRRKYPGQKIYIFIDDDLESVPSDWKMIDETHEIFSDGKKLPRWTFVHFSLTYKPKDYENDILEHQLRYTENRKDPILVELIEDYGSEKISGRCAKLEIEEIADDDLWGIEDYDGLETVITRNTYPWQD